MTAGKYFNRAVIALDAPHIGFVVRETADRIVVFGERNERYDIPISEIQTVSKNVLIGLNFSDIITKYKVDRDAPLPIGKSIDKLAKEQEDKKKSVEHVDKAGEAILTRMLEDNGPETLEAKEALDVETLSSRTQDRLWHALKERYQYNTSIKCGQDFLLKHVSTKLSLVIMYINLVGSTRMSMTLPVDQLVTIIRAFSYEMSSVVESYDGYVLKYLGDSVIALFPSGFNKYLTYDKAVRCAKSMISVLNNGLNPTLSKEDYPELQIKIGIDEGENVVVQYGYDRSSQIDLLGYTMNVAAKITSLTGPDKVSVGNNVYELLHPNTQAEFQESLSLDKEWKYLDSDTDKIYKVYTLK
jgi:adenylate cyclase